MEENRIEEFASIPTVGNIDYLSLTAFGAEPTAAKDQVPFLELQDYTLFGTSFESNIDDIKENWFEYVSETNAFLKILQILIKSRDIEAILYLLEKNHDYLADRTGEFQTGAPPYYIQLLLSPELFDEDDLFFIFSSLKGIKVEDVNGKELRVDPKIRLKKEDVYYKLVGIELEQEKLETIWNIVENIYRKIDNCDLLFYKTLRQIQFEYKDDDYPLDYLIRQRIADESPVAHIPEYIMRVNEPENIQEILADLKKLDNNYPLDIDKLSPGEKRELLYNPSLAEQYQEKYAFLRWQESLEKSDFLNCLFGPINRRPLLGDEICTIYGGCRMLTCPCLDGVDWFVGYCLHCFYRIEYISYALRIPHLEGSWHGCYCSFDCVENAIKEMYSFDVDFDFPNRALIQEKLSDFESFVPLHALGKMKKIIQTTGIFNMNDNDPNKYLPIPAIYEID